MCCAQAIPAWLGEIGAHGWNRTSDACAFNAPLYQLSYKGEVTLVSLAGFEPATSWSRTRRATGLRYRESCGCRPRTCPRWARQLAGLEEFESPTPAFVARYSVQLSYRPVVLRAQPAPASPTTRCSVVAESRCSRNPSRSSQLHSLSRRCQGHPRFTLQIVLGAGTGTRTQDRGRTKQSGRGAWRTRPGAGSPTLPTELCPLSY